MFYVLVSALTAQDTFTFWFAEIVVKVNGRVAEKKNPKNKLDLGLHSNLHLKAAKGA